MKHKLISDKQFGFMKNKGANDAIAMLSKGIYDNLTSSRPHVITFLDYSKAFDTIDHGILISKLHNMGIRGVCLLLIKSYLQDRVPVVKIINVKSQEIKTNMGVPQGSILGPLLFILYISDLLVVHKELIAYADDTAAPMDGDTWTQIAVNMTKKLENISP